MSFRPALLALPLAACGGLTSTVPSAEEYLDGDSGNGIAIVGDLAINPETINFGYVESGFSQDEILTLTNVGDYLLTVADFSVVGDGVFEITAVSLDDQAVSADEEITLSHSDSIELVVTFAPTEDSDAWAGAISFVSDISGSEYIEVAMQGTSIDTDTNTNTDTITGEIDASPAAIDFGEVDIGHSSDPVYVDFTNNTASNVAITNFEFSDTIWDWNNDFNLPWIMQPGETVTAGFLYTPTAEQDDYGTATAVTDDTSISGTVNLTGTGADLCDICAPQIFVSAGYAIADFLSILNLPDQRSVMVQNTGDEPLEISQIYVNNDCDGVKNPACIEGGEFLISGWNKAIAPVTLDPYQSYNFDISYGADTLAFDLPNPSSDVNILHILSNDPNSSDWGVELTGIGFGTN